MKDINKKMKKTVKKGKDSMKDVKAVQTQSKKAAGETGPEDKMRGALAKIQVQKQKADLQKQTLKKKELSVKSKIQTLKKKEKAQKELEKKKNEKK